MTSAVMCRLHLDESTLIEKKNAARVTSSIDLAQLSMDLPDQAVFSMDDPSSKHGTKPAAGGVMEVVKDDNMIMASQATAEANQSSTSVHSASRALTNGSNSTDSCSNDENEILHTPHNKPKKDRIYGRDRADATFSKIDANEPNKGNIVPFARFKMPHSQA